MDPVLLVIYLLLLYLVLVWAGAPIYYLIKKRAPDDDFPVYIVLTPIFGLEKIFIYLRKKRGGRA